MNLTFDARIVGREIHVKIGTDTALSALIFCFSLMAGCCVTPITMLKHPREDRPTGGLGRARLRQDRGNCEVLRLREGLQFADLRIDGENLTILRLGGLAGVEDIGRQGFGGQLISVEV